MAVIDIPVASLDNESDLMDWLATELVTNYRFTEERREGSVGANDLRVILERPQAETFHQDSLLTLYLSKGGNAEGASVTSSFQFNIAPVSALSILQTVAPASVTVDFVNAGGSQEIRSTGGAFTNWTAAGYSAGQLIRVADAATPANNGLYEISQISTTTFTNDSIEIREIANGGRKDIDTFDTGDVVTVSEELTLQDLQVISGFCATPRSDDTIWNCGVTGMYTTPPYIRARLITSVDAGSATPENPLQFIVVIETDTGIYRKFSFGEVVKLVEYTGGNYMCGDIFDAGQNVSGQTNQAPWLQGDLIETYDENFNYGANPGAVYAENFHSGGAPSDANGRGFMLFGAYGGASFDAPTHYNAAPYPHFLGAGGFLISYSPSAFSGQSEAYPITIFGTFNTQNYLSTAAQHAPMCIIPDVFLADITNLDAYSVFQDSVGDKFMVVPMYTKNGSGAGSSEKWGYLIRNPDLVVT